MDNHIEYECHRKMFSIVNATKPAKKSQWINILVHMSMNNHLMNKSSNYAKFQYIKIFTDNYLMYDN